MQTSPRLVLTVGRVLHGTRGLKPLEELLASWPCWSRPSRDAWIETTVVRHTQPTISGRVLHGTRGLKHSVDSFLTQTGSRGHHGTRGLKHADFSTFGPYRGSRPSRDAWIETAVR